MTFFEKSPKGPVSGGIIIWSCTSKIAEMNDSDRELFKTSKKFEIGSVENYFRLPAICEKIKKSVKSRQKNLLSLSVLVKEINSYIYEDGYLGIGLCNDILDVGLVRLPNTF